MKIEDINAVCTQFRQALVDTLGETVGLVLTRFVRVTLGRDHQATLLPFGVSGECLLLSSNVRSRGINFIVSLGLKVVENLVVLGRVSDTCSGRWIWSMEVSLEITEGRRLEHTQRSSVQG